MSKAFRRKLRAVRLRCSVNLLFVCVGAVMSVAAGVALAAVLVERLFAVELVRFWSVAGFWAAVAGCTVVLWLKRRPRLSEVGLLIDRRLQLRERFSTALAVERSSDPFARAACADAYRTAEGLQLRRHFPLRPPRSWLWASGLWALTIAVAVLLPQQDLFGLLERHREQHAASQQLQQAVAEVNEVTSSVKLLVRRLDPKLAETLEGLGQTPPQVRPQQIKLEAIRKLGELSEQIKAMSAQARLDSLELLQNMFKQLAGSTATFSQKLRQALAQGKFGEAADLLREVQRLLHGGKMDRQQQKRIAEQLRELARQLQQLAQSKAELERELAKLGLEKRLVVLKPGELRQALQRLGVDAKTIEKLIDKARACQAASGRCGALAQAMAACGGGGGLGQIGEVVEQLDQLETLQQQLLLAQASLDQIRQCIACLGKGLGQCLGAQGPFQPGQSDRTGLGSGGPGRGFGPRQTGTQGRTATATTRIKNKDKQGPVIASWYFKGDQVKGQVQRDFEQVVRAGRDNAAEAIRQKRIPWKYEEAVKSYFGRLEQAKKP